MALVFASIGGITRAADRVRIVATVRDVLDDELNPDYHFLILQTTNETVYAPIPFARGESLRKLIDAQVSVSGIWDNYSVPNARRHLGRQFRIFREGDIQTLQPASADPFNASALEDLVHTPPQEFAQLGKRRVRGRVLATWRGNAALLRTDSGAVVRLELADSDPPACNGRIEVVGYPETDLVNVNLSRAIYRPLSDSAAPFDEPTNVTAAAILFAPSNRVSALPSFHGRTVRLSGQVCLLPDAFSGAGRLGLDCDGLTVPVDISANPRILDGLSVGCDVRICGVCVMDVDNWRPNAAFPAIRGFFLVPRSAMDVEIVSGPPWWTTPRLLAAIGVLAALIVVLLAVGALLRLRARLRFEERTRLAAELHDYLAQNLTAVDYQLATYDRAKDSAPDLAAHCHETARRMLSSCRTELRRCLWDLRNDALEERTFDRAISTSIAPLLADAELHVRFNVPRGHVGDSAAHALLSVIRELVANAIKHGQATRIRIAGEERDALLRFSVTDNGTGFDLADCPDVATGHFGLLGVRERLRKLGGELALASSPGRGTRAVVTVPLRPYGKGTKQS